MISLSLQSDGALNLVDSLSPEPLTREEGVALSAAFRRGSGFGLFHLAARYPSVAMVAGVAYWRDFAKAALTKLLAYGPAALNNADATRWIDLAPPLAGGEYLRIEILQALWDSMSATAAALQEECGQPLQQLLGTCAPAWAALGRVCLSLAEHAADSAKPFALLATYTTRLALRDKPQHVPLGQVLNTLTTQGQRDGVTRIGAALTAAASDSTFLAELLASRRLFTPQLLTITEAHRFLRDAAAWTVAGLIVRLPSAWQNRPPPRVQVDIAIGDQRPAGVGLGALLSFKVTIALGGQQLSDEEWQTLKNRADGLVLVRGQWVEVDGQRLAPVLAQWRRIEAAAAAGLPLAQALRLMQKVERPASVLAPKTQQKADSPSTPAEPLDAAECSRVRAGEWLQETLAALRSPAASAALELGPALQASLRPYQKDGLAWLWTLRQLGFGGCLADDMGLGKTLQVLALFAMVQQQQVATGPHLLVVPATLLRNWQREAGRFTPQLTVYIAHPSAAPRRELAGLQPPKTAQEAAIVVTSYGALLRYGWLYEVPWDTVVLDEAQAIKNPRSRQATAARRLPSRHRLALTGTPVENKPLDLWSLFHFLQPTLLGPAAAFQEVMQNDAGGYGRVRALVQPFLLRRLKSDRRLLPDLPSKIEMDVRCALVPAQAALYARLVAELKADLQSLKVNGEATAELIAVGERRRRGAVLSTLLKLKQVCAHPALLTGDSEFAANASGKCLQLRTLAETVAARQEKLLVFTQFRLLTEVLAQQLTRVFGRPGLILHGGTAVNERQNLVERFQGRGGPPFFVLSTKAGGTGLTLTAAAHVVHFDRWWNPAVEDQATDRAYRIGQTSPVVVHKLTCAGTVEDRIAQLLTNKRQVAEALIVEGGELNISRLTDGELLALLALDDQAADLSDGIFKPTLEASAAPSPARAAVPIEGIL